MCTGGSYSIARAADLARKSANEAWSLIRIAATYKLVLASRCATYVREDNEANLKELGDLGVELAQKIEDEVGVQDRVATGTREVNECELKLESLENDIAMYVIPRHTASYHVIPRPFSQMESMGGNIAMVRAGRRKTYPFVRTLHISFHLC